MGLMNIGETAMAMRGTENLLNRVTENQVVTYEESVKQTALLEQMAESLKTIAAATDYLARAASAERPSA